MREAHDRAALRITQGALAGVALFLLALAGCSGGSSSRINIAPVANSACYAILNNQSAVSELLTATDPNGDELTYDIVDQPANGSVSTTPAGLFTYIPNANGTGRRGMDKFTFQTTDVGGLASKIGTVTILNDGKLRVMPLGDSITEGVNIANQPPAGQRVGYRRKLYGDLVTLANGGYEVDFVGQRSEGFSANPPIGDPDHQGTPGLTDAGLALNVIGYLNARPADIVLLHIGTNSFSTSAAHVEDILDNIATWEASNYPLTVFVARIIDDAEPPDLDVTTFNNNVQNMVTGRLNDRVIMVNQETGAGIVYTVGIDMADDLHPTQSGYDKLAAKWLTDMTNPANVGPKYLGLPECQ